MVVLLFVSGIRWTKTFTSITRRTWVFGGSTLEACVYFFERLLKPFNPQQLVIYAGDNDLGDGKQPNDVCNNFTRLVDLAMSMYPGVKLFYISIKPSIARFDIDDKIRATNESITGIISSRYPAITFIDVYHKMIGEDGKPITEYYVEDGLHLTEQGYDLWKEILTQEFAMNVDNSLIQPS